MKHLIEFLVNHLVEHPDQVAVEQDQDGYVQVYSIYAHPDDIGRIIGHHGRTIKAIRNIAKVIAIPRNEKFRLEIAD
ncbi:MAG: KH domain-containing protein [Patescibacteria group bacterium]|nr:KH domain-containing protein [Patescibacteria group bacterium]